jgi:hypothetical protein
MPTSKPRPVRKPADFQTRCSRDDNAEYDQITERCGYSDSSAMHRSAPSVAETVRRVRADLLTQGAKRTLTDEESKAVEMLQVVPRDRAWYDEQGRILDGWIRFKCSDEEKASYPDIAERLGLKQSVMHRTAPHALDAAHSVVEMLLTTAHRRALTPEEDDALRRLDLQRWGSASEKGRLTEPPTARR